MPVWESVTSRPTMDDVSCSRVVMSRAILVAIGRSAAIVVPHRTNGAVAGVAAAAAPSGSTMRVTVATPDTRISEWRDERERIINVASFSHEHQRHRQHRYRRPGPASG